MIIAESLADLRSALSGWRKAGQTIAFVPTMGNLHSGHMALVERAQQHADRVVVSIYVNPLQFGAGEDFEAYPRTLDPDRAKLAAIATDLLVLPRTADIYPAGCEHHTTVEVPRISEELCGRFRPGHFRGVATIVCKLLNRVQPDLLILGEKDYQQLVIIRRMVADLDLPVTVIGGTTVREPSGLAMSSRNAYLSPQQREQAAELSCCLARAASAIEKTRGLLPQIEADCAAQLTRSGFRVDYVSVRRAADLAMPSETDRSLVILAAAWGGRTRLIDNLLLERAPPGQQQ